MPQKQITLTGDEAVMLWKLGAKKWNAWVEEFPESSIEFNNVDFSEHLATDTNIISFENYVFPQGKIIFNDVRFGDAKVIKFSSSCFKDGESVTFKEIFFKSEKIEFNNVSFGKRDIKFIGCTFEAKLVKFNDSNFGDGDLDFAGSKYFVDHLSFANIKSDKGSINFGGVKFACKTISFNRATFITGNLSFIDANFSEGNKYFRDVNFGDTDVDFDDSNFNRGDLDFTGSKFYNGSISFDNTVFGMGEVKFTGVDFGTRLVTFLNNKFYNSIVSLDYIACNGLAITHDSPKEKNHLTIIDLTLFGATIKGPLILKGLVLTCIPDLRASKISHHLDIADLRILWKRDKGYWKTLWTKFTKDQTAQPKFRRLKEISEQFKHHKQALKFNRLEMQANRWTHCESLLSNLIDIAYSGLSHYGLSIKRPLFALMSSWLAFTALYSSSATYDQTEFSLKTISHMLIFSVSNSLPFITIGKTVRTQIESIFFMENINFFYSCIIIQNILSLFFVFLIGLGLRNEFRV